MTPPPYALHLAAAGLPVFPCRADKRPATPHGFKDATADRDALHTLWRRYPGPLIGMPTGIASGLDLLDIDPRHGGGDWLAENAAYMGDTLCIQTRSGGTHLFYKHRQGVRNSEGVIAPGIDVRGEGGYAIRWERSGGFVVRDLPVIDWPEWLGDLAFLATKANRQPAAAQDQRPPPPPIATDTHVRRMMQRCLDRVSNASAGQRHYELRAASCAVGGLLGPDIGETEAADALLDAVRNAGGEPIDEKNAATTIKSGLAKGKASPFVRAA